LILTLDVRFLWVKFQIDSLTSQTTDNEVKETLKCLPDGLHNVYKRALQRIQQQPIQKRNLAWKVLMWTVHAKTPLTLDQIIEAVAIERGITHIDRGNTITDKSLVTAVCADLIMVDQTQTQRVQAVHSSVKEFFASITFAPDHLAPDTILSASAASTQLAEACLSYLLFEEFRMGPSQTNDEFTKRLERHKFLGHAASSCIHYVQDAGEREVIALLLEFVNCDGARNSFIQVLCGIDEIESDRFQNYPKLSSRLHLVARFGLRECINDIWDSLETDAQPNSQDSLGRTPLLLAAQYSQEHIVDTLLNQGADCRIPNEEGLTPFHYAAQNGNMLLVERLIVAGADVNAKSGGGRSALHEAAANDHLRVVDYLLGAGVQLEAVDETGQSALHLAANSGYLSIVSRLLEAGADPKALTTGDCPMTALALAAWEGHTGVVRRLLPLALPEPKAIPAVHCAAYSGHLSVLELLLAADMDINIRDSLGNTALHVALQLDQIETSQYLISNGADVLITNNHGRSVLHHATSGVVGPFELLIASGAKLDVQDDIGLSSLHLAIIDSNDTVAEWLIAIGADIDPRSDSGATPLILATIFNRPVIVEALLKHGADANARNNKNLAALHFAAEMGYLDTLTLLLEFGADILIQDDEGWTGIHWAAGNGQGAAVELLLSRGLGPDTLNNRGSTPLLYASLQGFATGVSQLVAAGAHVNAQDSIGESAVYLAAHNGHEETVVALLALGADPMLPKDDGYTAIHSAAQGGHMACVDKLIAIGEVDVNVQNYEGVSVLQLAARKGHSAVVSTLLQAGADPEAVDKLGWTALHSAAGNGNDSVVDQLLAAGADATVQNNNGWTALHRAAEGGHHTIVRQLMEAGVDVNKRNSTGNTGLMLASRNGHDSVVRELLHSAANPRLNNTNNGAAPHGAAYYRHSPIVDQPLEGGVELNVQDNIGYSALSRAALGDRVSIVDKPLAAGADPGFANNRGHSALHLASMHGHATVLKLLLSTANLDPTVGDCHEWTPFHMAAFHQQEPALQTLSTYAKDKSYASWYPLAPIVSEEFSLPDELSHAALLADNSLGWTGAHLATLLEKYSVMDRLACSGVDMLATDKNGMSPLHWAAAAGLDKAVEELLKFEVELSTNSKDRWQRTPYDIAFKSSTIQMLSSSPETRPHALSRGSRIRNLFLQLICSECQVNLDGLFSCE
jgi:ankyrin repeat protein